MVPNSGDKTAVFLQKACLQHRFIRSKDTSSIVERPERLRAVNLGLAAAFARLNNSNSTSAQTAVKSEGLSGSSSVQNPTEGTDELTAALEHLNITSSSISPQLSQGRVEFVHSDATLDLLNHPAVKFVHGDITEDMYLGSLKRWARYSKDAISRGDSEIPSHLSQGDLYSDTVHTAVCPESIDAIQGALGTVCEAVDTVLKSTSRGVSEAGTKASRAFVGIRPPGHHCGEDSPAGFCFVNNVGVAAAHAHLQHGINRVVILDIDLHHGNGTQSIAWQINEETYRQHLEEEADAPVGKPGLQVYYGSIHDVLSYPCEDGKPELVQAASVSIHGPHGQYIENVHLTPYNSENQFWTELYAGPYSSLLGKAGEFLETTGGPGDDVLVFISCGFDANEHEYPSMSRHHRHVPTTFYYRFAQDTRKFADSFAHGRVISVLEGGYSDRALTSGAMAHLTGLACSNDAVVDESWWNLNNLVELEKAAKKRRGGRTSQPTAPALWIEQTLTAFASIDSSYLIPSTSSRSFVPPSSRVLRGRKSPPVGSNDETESPVQATDNKSIKEPQAVSDQLRQKRSGLESPPSDSNPVTPCLPLSDIPEEGTEPKKLPRVILRLGPRPANQSGD
ncbi:uncharacterized protein FIBRA_01746 [Fibroporia radiculosa]|uniref:Histone deacetylase domain-containing protein n=1 Tax=Fibroporia radiculosa TaxID=599839 RepID=J4H1E5_9APHY|nr:uncharacterized protein FIBRA_01746 [Fibroporia radiculosa]CCL99724.1 predicted protein [Fibroporia radiculosa]